jgi:hypothetical protein
LLSIRPETPKVRLSKIRGVEMPDLTLESEEWYVLTNWLRERENRLQYALRDKSAEWEFVHGLRRDIERQREENSEAAEDAATTEDPETTGLTETVTLSNRQVGYLSSFLRKRSRRLLFLPWRDRERRDVRHLRDHLLAEAGRAREAEGAGKAERAEEGAQDETVERPE